MEDQVQHLDMKEENVAKKNNLLMIRFKNVSVTVKHTDSVPGYDTFGKKLVACFFGLCLKMARPRAKASKIEVLKNISVMPGTMTLLLGPPGSGKSTLLKVLEGKLQKEKNLKQEGAVLYNKNVLTSHIAPRKPIAYITESRNVHLPVFTVRETLEFAQGCLEATNIDRFMPFSVKPSPENENPYLEFVLQKFGLKEIEHQKVGTPDDGISDGERIRLSIAEVAMGTHSVLLLDHPCSGQDSLFTYDVLSVVQSVTHLHQASAVMALTQVAPEFYNIFDRLILLSEGKLIFQGPPNAAEKYFSELGYTRPPHIDTGTFLEDIAAGDGARYNSRHMTSDELVSSYEMSEHYKDVLRIVSSDGVVNTFWTETERAVEVSLHETTEGADVLVTQSSELSRRNSVVAGDKITGVYTPSGEIQYIGSGDTQKSEAAKVAELLETPLPQPSLSIQVERRLDEHGDDACYDRRFNCQEILNWFFVTKILIKRQAKFSIRLKKLLLLRLMQVTIISLFIGTLFYQIAGQIDQSKMNSVRSIGFVSMLHLLLLSIIQLPVLILVHRPVFYKQRAQHMFGVSSYIVAHGVVNLPQAALESFIYSISVYFFASLSRETVARYFQYWAVLFLISYLGSWYMILVSAVAPVLEVATAMAGFLIVLNLLFSGFPIVLSGMRHYWKWLLYLIPTRWASVIFSSTQIDKRYNVPCSSRITFTFCLANPTLSVGEAFLKLYDVEGGNRKLILSYSLMVVFILGVAGLSYLAYRRIEIMDIQLSIPREKYFFTVLPENSLEHAENGGVYEDTKWTSHLPIKPMTLIFQNLKMLRKDRISQKEGTILSSVSGYVKPGQMLAIVGNMHSGKKSLLGCISGRCSADKFEGQILLNASKMDSCRFFRVSGFVSKREKHQPFLTVKESIEFSASLWLGREVSSSDKAIHVNSVIELMELTKVSNHLVGSLKYTVQRVEEVSKNLTIAVELAGNPSILFLEDPTSLLDSLGTRKILTLLQKISIAGCTVVSTLDHPSSEALAFFDKALILKLGGHEVYFGPVGFNSSAVLDYFSSIPGVPKYDGVSLSPLTYILDIIGDGGIKRRQPVTDFTLAYQESSLHKENMEEMQILLNEQHEQEEPVMYRYPARYRTQVAMVFLRNQRVLYRNVLYTFSRLAASIGIGLLMGTLFLQMNLEKLLSMAAATILPYMQAILISGLISNNVILQLGTDREVYKRENRARMYAPILYPLSWGLAELPYLFISTLVFLAISNSMAGVGVTSFSVFIKYWMGLFLFSVAVTYYGILITLLTHHPLLALTLVSITTSIWIGGSGVSVPRYNTKFYKWLYWIDPFQYVVNILTSVAFYCDTSTAACKSCYSSYCSSDCSCKRLYDVEAQVLRVSRMRNMSTIPAVFVWDRVQSSRVIERHRNGEDFMALGITILVFAVSSLVVFRLKHSRR